MGRPFRKPSSALRRGLVVLVVACGAVACRAPEETHRAPNFLFLFADDQRADAIGAYGHPDLRTPTLDSLSAVGFNFREAHIMGAHHGAVCAPSRAMLMSGRGLFRVYDNLDTVATFPELLRASGYVTFATGKWHQSEASFARSFSVGQDVFFGGMSDHQRVPVRDLLPGGSFTDPAFEGFSTDLFADAAIRFLEAHAAAGDTAPFLAYVSFTAPHDPRTPPAPFDRLYQPDSLSLPANFLPVHPFHNGWMTGRDETLAPWPRTPEVIRSQLADYYGLIAHLDARMSDVLTTLRRTHLDERTVVVFAADNGLALGSHGLLGKQSLYEHSTRVPLLIAGPGIPAGTSAALVSLYDLFPTILGLAGTQTPAGVDGRDLSVLWRGDTDRVRDDVYLAYEDLQRAVRTDGWKLIRYPRLHIDQLFDLRSDPHETRNLASRPEHRAQLDLLTSLLERRHAEWRDPHPLLADSVESMVFDPTSVVRLPDEHQPAWVIEKYFPRGGSN